jgi:Family of unknown function (DUF6489)
MKANIEIDCTPVEARQFFGLPNVEPMQAAVMQQLEKRMLADIDRLSPETLMKNCLAVGPLWRGQDRAIAIQSGRSMIRIAEGCSCSGEPPWYGGPYQPDLGRHFRAIWSRQ